MKPDPINLSSLIESVVDGSPWNDAVEDGLLDDSERKLVANLRLVASVARVHQRQAERAEVDIEPERPARIVRPGRWGHLELVEQVGTGAFGEVWRARDVMLDTEVALKLLHPRPGQATIFVKLIQEGRALARLRHPNVVTVHGVEEHDGDIGLRMEFIRGETLERLLREHGPFSSSEAGLIGRDVARALAAVHRAGLIHRDLKAQNVMREEGGRIVLMDLGSGLPQSETVDAGLAGTPLCLAPEVLAGAEPTVASDIYSLGVLLYHLVTDSYPVVATSIDALRSAHQAGDVRSLSEVRPDLPESFVGIVGRALAARPQDRYPSAAALGAALGQQDGIGRFSALRRWVGGAASSPARVARFVAAALLVAAISAPAVWAVVSWARPNAPVSAAVSRIAVLPFTIANADAELEYLSNGIPMELTASLGQIGALKVVPWSFMKGLNPTSTMDEVRRRTGADAIIEGTIQRVHSGSDSLRLKVQVYQAGSGALMWTQTLERPIGAVLRVQSDVARQIAERLNVLIARREQMLLSRFRDIPADAVELYLKGRQAWEDYRDDFAKAIDYFQKAIAIHPGFADAYAALADCYALQSSYAGAMPAAEAFPRALAAANRALELNATLPEAFATRGFAKAALAWDWRGADEDFRQAIDLDPQSPAVRTTYSNYLTMVGRHPEAIEQSRLAEERAPLSPVVSRRVGWALYMAGRFDDAIVQLRAVLEIEPNYGPARTLLARAYAEAEDRENAVKYIQPVAEGFEALSAQVYARVGLVAEARKLLAVATAPSSPRNPSYQIGAAYAALGELDTAVGWLERAFDSRDTALVNIAFDPRLRALRGYPSFESLVQRLNLTPRPGK